MWTVLLLLVLVVGPGLVKGGKHCWIDGQLEYCPFECCHRSSGNYCCMTVSWIVGTVILGCVCVGVTVVVLIKVFCDPSRSQVSATTTTTAGPPSTIVYTTYTSHQNPQSGQRLPPPGQPYPPPGQLYPPANPGDPVYPPPPSYGAK